MDCKNVENQLQELLDGGLGPAQSQGVQNHVASCASCATRYESLRFIAQSIHSLPLYQVSPGFDQKVVAALERSTAPLPAKWTTWTAGSLLLLISGWMTAILSAAAPYLNLLRIVQAWEFLFHPSRLLPLLEMGVAKTSLSLVQLFSVGQGLWGFLNSGIVGPALVYQIGFSSLLAGALIVTLSKNNRSKEKWRIA